MSYKPAPLARLRAEAGDQSALLESPRKISHSVPPVTRPDAVAVRQLLEEGLAMKVRTPIGVTLAGASCVTLLQSVCSCSGSATHDTARPSAAKTNPASSTQAGSSQAGSSQASSSQAGKPKLDACTVMTAADVHAVLGGTVSVKRDNGDGKPGCDFNVAGSVLGNYASVDIFVDTSVASVGAAVPGVGDSAYYDTAETDEPYLAFTKDGATVDMTYGSDTQVAADKQQFTIKFPANIKALTIALGKDMANRI